MPMFLLLHLTSRTQDARATAVAVIAIRRRRRIDKVNSASTSLLHPSALRSDARTLGGTAVSRTKNERKKLQKK